jgi:electron transfer flavoprotein alpha subunit
MSNTLVIIQVLDGQVTDVSLQCLAKARALGGSVHALVAGAGVKPLAASLIAAGADTVHVAEHAQLAAYVTPPFARVTQDTIKAVAPALVLVPATTFGNDLAPTLAARLDAACVLDGDDVTAEGGSFAVRRTEFDRKAATWLTAAGSRLVVATLKDGAVAALAPDAGRTGAVTDVAVTLGAAEAKASVIKRDVAKKSVNLKEAHVIVAAGAGVGTKENFTKIQELAAALGAQIGATRAVVDAGWLPADHQIGQTGATVRPDLYVGCGVSGAVQHWVGMMDSRTIIAINSDKNAPLMKRAHYRVAGDLNVVIPKLIKLLK